MPDPYQTLGVKRDASADEIKRAYRKLAKTYHPDHNRGDAKAATRFAEVNNAYEILGDASHPLFKSVLGVVKTLKAPLPLP